MAKWFEQKKVTASFGIAALIGGLVFLTKGRITGNVIFHESSSFEPLSLIGSLLLLCSAILIVYTLKH
jgi:hypothetical protein